MEQEVFTNKEERTTMSEKESKQSIVNAKEKIKVNYDGSGECKLNCVSKENKY